tara:strand:- start:5183 stop:8617 length:3435 start_codon:yes stop_codon:yes gene_type:complete
MPKQEYKIERFDGGLNTDSDSRDIEINESDNAFDIGLTKGKELNLPIGTEAHSSDTTGLTCTTNDGYGLFAFSHDRIGASVGGLEHFTDGQLNNTTSKWTASTTTSSASFPDFEQISHADNRTSFAGANCEWEPFGANVAPSITKANGELTIAPTSDSGFQGVQLVPSDSFVQDIVIGGAYTITAEIWWDSGSDPSVGNAFHIQLAGVSSAGFAVSATSSGTTYTANLTITEALYNPDQGLIIDNSTANTANWNLNNITVTKKAFKESKASATSLTTLSQTAGDRALKGANDCNYKFTYTVLENQNTTDSSGSSNSGYHTGQISNTFSASAVNLEAADLTEGTHTKTFVSNSNASSQSFAISLFNITSNTSTIVIDNLKLEAFNPQDTGDNYLMLSDTDTGGTISIYSANSDSWATPITGLTDNTGGKRKEVFTIVDGNIRICDSEFNNTNKNKWYGFIDKQLWPTRFNYYNPNPSLDQYVKYGNFGAMTEEVYNGWVLADQEINAPTRGLVGSSYSDFAEGDTVLFKLDNDNSSATSLQNTDAVGNAATFERFTTDEIDGKGYSAINSTTGSWGEITAKTSDDILSIPGGITGGSRNGFEEDDEIIIAPPVGTGFNLRINQLGSANQEDGLFDGGNDYEWATTFIYDGVQESLPFKLGGYIDKSTDTGPIMISWQFRAPFNPRITGARAYYRIKDSESEWFFAQELNFAKGSSVIPYSSIGGYYQGVSISTRNASGYISATAGGYVINSGVYTYESLNSYRSTEASLNARWSTSVIANRRHYIGNIKSVNSDGEEVVMSDRMIKSPVNAFDIFPQDNAIDVAVNDGSPIVKLLSYADRIFQFKKNNIFIINISQEIEFLEQTISNQGITHPEAAKLTDLGIVWVNKNGVYLYNGTNITNLLHRADKKLISSVDWADFTSLGGTYTSAATQATPTIHYLPKVNSILVIAELGDINNSRINKSALLYDVKNQAWSYLSNNDTSRILDKSRTNSVLDHNNKLIYAYNNGANVLEWSVNPKDSSGFIYTTKDIDFGSPGIRKKIYKVYITYTSTDPGAESGTTTNVQVKYSTNGSKSYNQTFQDGTNLVSNELSAAIGWQRATLKPSTSSTANNIYSFALQFTTDGTVPSKFRINDITIIYRQKGIK